MFYEKQITPYSCKGLVFDLSILPSVKITHSWSKPTMKFLTKIVMSFKEVPLGNIPYQKNIYIIIIPLPSTICIQMYLLVLSCINSPMILFP
jgi:hypothetical protein